MNVTPAMTRQTPCQEFPSCITCDGDQTVISNSKFPKIIKLLLQHLKQYFAWIKNGIQNRQDHCPPKGEVRDSAALSCKLCQHSIIYHWYKLAQQLTPFTLQNCRRPILRSAPAPPRHHTTVPLIDPTKLPICHRPALRRRLNTTASRTWRSFTGRGSCRKWRIWRACDISRLGRRSMHIPDGRLQ